MDPTQIYAVAAGGAFSLFALVHFCPYIILFFTRVSVFISKHLTYSYLLHRHRILGPWTRAGIVIQLAYLAVNVFCVSVVEISWNGLRGSTVSDAGRRASTLAMVNMIPTFAGFHHAFLADQLGLSLKTIRGIHRSAGWMTCGFVLLHALVAASKAPLPLSVPQNLFAVIVCSPSPLPFSWLKFHRLRRCFVFSLSCCCPRSAGSHTNSSSAHTKPLPWEPFMRSGDMSPLTTPSLAPMSISVWRFPHSCSSCRA